MEAKFKSYEIWVNDIKEDTVDNLDKALDKAKELTRFYSERSIQIVPKR